MSVMRLFPEVCVDVAQESIYVGENTSTVLDPAWRYVDSNGHGHFTGCDPREQLPTLRWVAEPCHLGHGDDCDAEGAWYCRICSEPITPGTKIEHGPTHIPGMIEITVTLKTLDAAGRVCEMEFKPSPEDLSACREAIGDLIIAKLGHRLVSAVTR